MGERVVPPGAPTARGRYAARRGRSARSRAPRGPHRGGTHPPREGTTTPCPRRGTRYPGLAEQLRAGRAAVESVARLGAGVAAYALGAGQRDPGDRPRSEMRTHAAGPNTGARTWARPWPRPGPARPATSVLAREGCCGIHGGSWPSPFGSFRLDIRLQTLDYHAPGTYTCDPMAGYSTDTAREEARDQARREPVARRGAARVGGCPTCRMA